MSSKVIKIKDESGNYLFPDSHRNSDGEVIDSTYLREDGGNSVKGTILPDVNGTYDIGSSDYKFFRVYARALYEDGKRVTNYNNSSNKPSINGVELKGDKSSADLLLKNILTPQRLVNESNIAGNNTIQITDAMSDYIWFLFDVSVNGYRTSILIPSMQLKTSALEYYAFDGTSTDAGMQIWHTDDVVFFKRNGSTSCTLSVYAI